MTAVEYTVDFKAQANVVNEYVDITDHAIVTPLGGMVIREIGEGVKSDYYDFNVTFNPETNAVTLEWLGNTADIDVMAPNTYTLGEGDEFITVFVNPAKIKKEDFEALTAEDGPHALTSRILVNKDRVINAFSETAPAPYGDAKYYLNAVTAMDVACGTPMVISKRSNSCLTNNFAATPSKTSPSGS